MKEDMTFEECVEQLQHSHSAMREAMIDASHAMRQMEKFLSKPECKPRKRDENLALVK